ncbi:MAG: hypothetical protein KDC12_15240 [Flavobacteriales bacterium]|nr:hypothetical protein [Flavobacteriales bacterium]
MTAPRWHEEFAELWNAANSLDEFVDTYPRQIKRKSATVMASTLRKQGFDLKRFNTPRQQAAHQKRKIEALRTLKDIGATYQLLGDALGVSKQAIHQMLQEE